jgi:hypothetical protein
LFFTLRVCTDLPVSFRSENPYIVFLSFSILCPLLEAPKSDGGSLAHIAGSAPAALSLKTSSVVQRFGLLDGSLTCSPGAIVTSTLTISSAELADVRIGTQCKIYGKQNVFYRYHLVDLSCMTSSTRVRHSEAHGTNAACGLLR